MIVRDDVFAGMERIKSVDRNPVLLQSLCDHAIGDAVGKSNQFQVPAMNDTIRKIIAATYWENLREVIASSFGVNPNDAWYVFAPGGSGDVMFVLSFLKAFRATHEGAVVLVTPGVYRSLCTLYTDDYDHVCHLIPHWDFLAEMHAVEKGQPIVAGHGKIGRYGDWRVLRDIVTLNNLYCLFMGLPFHTEPAPPPVHPQSRDKARAILETRGLRVGKTAILAPFSRSTATPPMSWWVELTGALKRRGYDVATNVAEIFEASPYQPIEGTVPVSCEHEDVVALVEEAGFFIASRSGLSDIVSFSAATMRFVYAAREHQEKLNNCGIITVNDHQSVARNRHLNPDKAYEAAVDLDGRFDEGILAGF